MLRLDPEHTLRFLDPADLERWLSDAGQAHRTLLDRSGPGAESTGWRDLLVHPDEALLEDVATTAERIRHEADVFLCIGIGGSYLGARAVIEALMPGYYRSDGTPEILFAGHHASGAYLRDLLDHIGGRSLFVNVISKSGRTLEPAIAFRLIRQHLQQHFEDADRRVILTTDPRRGTLSALHERRGYRKFVIPSEVGGRFSVLTPVGLLPIAVAGIDVTALFHGAVQACRELDALAENPALLYAALRYGMLQQGMAVDLLSVFEPRLRGFGEWWQQLFGESEGKDGTGLFPVVAQYSTDLHSIGQYVQEGRRMLMETFLMVEEDGGGLTIPRAESNLDELDYLVGKDMATINRAAYEATAQAHADGGVPNLTLWMKRANAAEIGAAIYFFEHAVAVSGYLLGINPFDQPGVEAYKREMFQRLGKP